MLRWVWLLLVAAIVWGCSESAPQSGPAQLGIEHVVEGDGPSPVLDDVVKVHYHGTLPDGTVFDSTIESNRPATFPLRRVVACWKLGLQQMKVGGKAKLTCPPQLAYGARGAPPRIPPNATLHFDVELLAIQ